MHNSSADRPATLKSLSNLLAALIAIGLANASFAGPLVSYQTVALTGQHALGPNIEARFSGFYGLRLGDGGHVTFSGSMSGADVPSFDLSRGLWAGQPGKIVNVLRSAVAAPAVDADYYTNAHAFVNAHGDLAIMAHLHPDQVGSGRDHVMWLGAPDDLNVLAREGSHAPGTPVNTVFGNLTTFGIAENFRILDFTDNSRITFVSGLLQPDRMYSEGIWTGSLGNLTLIARDGSQAHGLSNGITYQRVYSFEISDDYFAFGGFIRGPSVNPLTDVGIWTGRSDSIRLVAREGDFIPGSRTVAYGMLNSDVQLDHDGRALFRAELVGQGIRPSNDISFWLSGPTDPQLLFQEGMAIPGFSNLRFTDLSVQPGPAEQYVVMARFSGDDVTETNNSALFLGTPDGLRMIAREGMQAPGAEPGVLFGDMIFVRTPFTPSGQLAFSNVLSGEGVSPVNNAAYYIADTDGVPYLVAREGSLLEIGNGQSKRISFLDEIGVSKATFNSQGELFFRASFGDEEGLFIGKLIPDQVELSPNPAVDTVPEPVTYLLAGTAIAIILLVRLYRRTVSA